MLMHTITTLPYVPFEPGSEFYLASKIYPDLLTYYQYVSCYHSDIRALIIVLLYILLLQ